MTDNEINRTIHEAMGKCWHKESTRWFEGWGIKTIERYCSICDSDNIFNPNYTESWQAFGEAFEWAQKQEWWKNFCFKFSSTTYIASYFEQKLQSDILLSINLINPRRFATALAEFLKEEK